MSDDAKAQIGSVVWRDLTVPDAAPVRDFYAQVVGWDPERFPSAPVVRSNRLVIEVDASGGVTATPAGSEPLVLECEEAVVGGAPVIRLPFHLR